MKIILETVGADPEFFIRRKKDGTFMPSSLITSGTKRNPEKTTNKEFFIHKDNLTVEGNIPPARSKKEFVSSMKFLKEIINTLAEIKECELVCEDIAEFKPRFLNLPDANDFGCSGYNLAWDNKLYDVCTPRLTNNQRIAGFHVHLGYNIKDKSYTRNKIAQAIGRAYDIFVTLPSDEIKYTPFRRENYGVPGAIRVKSYGVECRSLGGFFTQDKYLGWVYDQVIKMFEWLNIDNNIDKILSIQQPLVNDYKSRLEEIKNILKIKETIECIA